MRKMTVIFLVLGVFFLPREFEREIPVIKTKVVKERFFESVVASWYGKPFHGRRTANGEVYDMYKISAAHRGLRLGTWVMVVNPENGKSVVLRINDRGPYISGRHLDLSYGAAKAISVVKEGVVRVAIKVLSKKDFRICVFQENDTLWKLFGPKWKAVADLNRVDPTKIRPGTELKVPFYL